VTRHGLAILGARSLLILVVIAGWQWSSGRIFDSFWLAAPADIAAYLWDWVATGSLWMQLWTTVSAVAIGYLIGCTLGVIAGVVLGRMPLAYRVLSPYFTALYSVPKVAFAPLFVIIFGIGLESKVALATMVVFFILLYNTLDGRRDVDEDLLRSVALMGAGRGEIVFKILIPSIIPWILTGLRIALPNALTSVVLGELISSNRGIGYLISFYSGQYDSVGVYAAVVVLLLCSALITAAINRFDIPTPRQNY
jgi:NitT/TauT family transport system permease protein